MLPQGLSGMKELNKASFEAVMQKDIYDIVNKMEEVTGGREYIEWDQFKTVIMEFINEEDLEKATAYFHERKVGDKLYYQLLGGSGTTVFVETEVSRWAQADEGVLAVKRKLSQVLQQSKMGLKTFFTFLDKDRSKDISLQELQTRMAKYLTASEAETLFRAIDIDKSQSITQEEFLQELSLVNCQFILQSLKDRLKEVGGFEKTYDMYVGGNGRMEANEFAKVIDSGDDLDKLEVDSVFRHFDTASKGYITKEEFVRAFESPFSLDSSIRIYEKDIIVPMKTKMTKSGIIAELPKIYVQFKSPQNPEMTQGDF